MHVWGSKPLCNSRLRPQVKSLADQLPLDPCITFWRVWPGIYGDTIYDGDITFWRLCPDMPIYDNTSPGTRQPFYGDNTNNQQQISHSNVFLASNLLIDWWHLYLSDCLLFGQETPDCHLNLLSAIETWKSVKDKIFLELYMVHFNSSSVQSLNS